MEVSCTVKTKEEVESAKAKCIRALKDRIWNEVWREEVDLPGMSVSVDEVVGGWRVMAWI